MPDPDLLAELDEAAIAAARDEEIQLLTERLRDSVAAVERVRALHTRSDRPVVTRHVCTEHAYAHVPTAGWHDAVKNCPACTVTERYVCTHCRHECPDDDTWPCPTVRALEGEQ